MQLVSKEKQAQKKFSQELLDHSTQQSKVYIFCLFFSKLYCKKISRKQFKGATYVCAPPNSTLTDIIPFSDDENTIVADS